MKEECEIVPRVDGKGLVARVIWGHICIEENLPIGFETWEAAEQQAHMRRFIAPSLKTKMTRARAGQLPLDQMASSAAGIVGTYRATVPKNETEARELLTPEEIAKLPLADQERIARAATKRRRRALKAAN
jgi:hypothetical protein